MHAACSCTHVSLAPHTPVASPKTQRLFHRTLLTLSICLLAACGGGGGGQSASPEASATAPPVTLSGQATFDYVPSVGGKLLYTKTEERPIRGATLEIVDHAGTLLQRTKTDAQGNYRVTLPSDLTVRLRVLAEIDANGVTVNVADNTRADALYALESEEFSANKGQADLHAGSGWTGSGYGQPRAAAPFAILATVYRAQQKLMAVEPAAGFKPLTLHWSEKNKRNAGDLSTGNIGVTFFRRGGVQGDIYVLGDADTDTDEYDESVIAHEWGHYYQWVFSRNDSLGGAHGGEPLEMTTAFAEGWGHGISGIVNERADISDSLDKGQAGGYAIPLQGVLPPAPGWYDEVSVAQVVYQLGQKAGLAPIHAAMKAMANTPAFTSIFSFANAVRNSSDAAGDALDPLLTAQSIVTSKASGDPYGSGETNDWGMAANGVPPEASVLPIYRPLTLVKPDVSCSFDFVGINNKLGNHHFIRFDAPAAGKYRLTFQGGARSDGTIAHPEVSWLENGRRVWYRPGLTQFDREMQLPAGVTVLSVTDKDVNSALAPVGCIRVSISALAI